MKKIKNIFVFTTIILTSIFHYSCSQVNNSEPINEIEEEVTTNLIFTTTVPIGPNSWFTTNLAQNDVLISEDGIHNWTSLKDIIKTYVKIGAGTLDVGLKVKSPSGTSKISVTIGSTTKEVTINNTDYATIDVGSFTVADGYNTIEIKGIAKSGNYIADINDMLFGGSAVSSGINFVPKTNYHFGRRGPSVHFSYTSPQGENVQWFYNEVTVASGQDKLGSFFMANGHGQGYFGLQVNSETERRVLFSIWSAYETNDPSQIPNDYKVTSLGSGNGVTVQDFGNEGSGKQTFKNVNWKTGVTYKFLLKGEPAPNGMDASDYTGYYFDPQVGEWQLIASLRRPKKITYLTGLYSFLENFNTKTGTQSRKVNYSNQWVYTSENTWIEITKANFTVDATAANGDRLDFSGGVENNSFFLKNCGFFNANLAPNTPFIRTANGTAPAIDFSNLPVPKPPQVVSLINRASWTVIDFSSHEEQGEGETGRATDVLDEDLETYWHSCWSGSCSSASYPHFLTIDMGANIDINGLQINQRSNESRAVKNITVSISTDNTNWTSLGDFDLIQSASNQNVDFGSLQTTRYIKITMNSAHDGERFASLAEVKGFKN